LENILLHPPLLHDFDLGLIPYPSFFDPFHPPRTVVPLFFVFKNISLGYFVYYNSRLFCFLFFAPKMCPLWALGGLTNHVTV
jgi:hypothetical protein